jgi:hypothetical protein
MTDQSATFPLTTDPRAKRRFFLAATISHIDTILRGEGELLPFRAADRLIAELVAADIATFTDRGGLRTLSLLGVAVQADCTAHGLLRNWQGRAKDKLRELRE